MALKKQEIQILWIVGIILVGIVLFKYSGMFSIINPYTNTAPFSYNGYNIILSSDKNFGNNNINVTSPLTGLPVIGETYNNILTNSISFDYTDGSGSIPINRGATYITNLGANHYILVDKQFNLNQLNQLRLDFTRTSTYTYGTSFFTCRSPTLGNIVNIYFSNENEDYLIYSMTDAEPQSGNIIITKDQLSGIYYKDINNNNTAISINGNTSYRLKIIGNTRLQCDDSEGGMSVAHKFTLTNLQLNYKNTSVCQPKTCSDLRTNCGLQDNGCGTIITCGQCSSGSFCNNSGQCNLIPQNNQSNQSCASFGLCTGSNGTCITCPSNGTVCTQEAKKCDDGSYVSRNSSLNCTFNACPTPGPTPNWWVIAVISIIIIGVVVYFIWSRK